MAAGKSNYLVLYTTSSQVYGSTGKDIALGTPLPKGTTIEDKRVFFITYAPDEEILCMYRVPHEEVVQGHEEYLSKKKKKDEEDQTDS